MAAQLCEYTENQGIVHFKWATCMVCELYLNKADILKNLCPDERGEKGNPEQ